MLKNNRLKLVFFILQYGLILFLLLAAQVAIGAYALVEINRADGDYDFKNAVREAVNKLFGNYTQTHETVAYIQKEVSKMGPYAMHFFTLE